MNPSKMLPTGPLNPNMCFLLNVTASVGRHTHRKTNKKSESDSKGHFLSGAHQLCRLAEASDSEQTLLAAVCLCPGFFCPATINAAELRAAHRPACHSPCDGRIPLRIDGETKINGVPGLAASRVWSCQRRGPSFLPAGGGGGGGTQWHNGPRGRFV